MRIKRFFMIVCGTLIFSISFNIFFSPYYIVPGGVSGIAEILNYLFSFNESLVVLILSLILFIIGFIFLDKEEMLRSFIGSILFPLFIYLSNLILVNMNIIIDNKLVAALVGGVVFGFGLGIVYKEGYTTGGVDIITKILNKYLHVSFGIGTFFLDSIVVVFGTIVFGFESLIYSAIAIYTYSAVIDKVILGFTGNKSFYIITNNPNDIKKFIINDLGHGVTILKGKGAFTNKEKSILFVVIPTRDYYKLRDGIRELDKEAFFVVSTSYEVGGGKWKNILISGVLLNLVFHNF